MENRVEYLGARKSANSDFEKSGKSIFAPNKIMFFIFLAILAIVLIFNLLQFPLMKFFSMQSLDDGLSIKFGWPITFLIFDLYSTENTSFQFGWFLLDFLIYLIVAYLLTVFVNYLLRTKFVRDLLEKREFKEARPKIVPKNVELRPLQPPMK